MTPSTVVAAPISLGVGFEQARMGDGTEVGVWFPARGQPEHQRLGLYEQSAIPNAAPTGGRLPLIVMSHGNGGHFAGHHDTAIALARAGFVVAALTHPGDNWKDQSRATQIAVRPAALSALITHMLKTWRFSHSLDPGSVGAFGFSAGGFTVLAAAGGRPDLTRIAHHCANHPGFFDCDLIRTHPRWPTAWPGRKDARIKAIVVAAPALGFTFDRAGLERIRVPVQLWRARNDKVLPAPFYADAVRTALPRSPEFHDVPGAGHYDFLAPCTAIGRLAPICASAGFDRSAFHARFNDAVVRFFRMHLQSPVIRSKGRRGPVQGCRPKPENDRMGA